MVTASVLEYGMVIFSTGGTSLTLSIRDVLFIITALITIGAALRAQAMKARNKRRRRTDTCLDKAHNRDMEYDK